MNSDPSQPSALLVRRTLRRQDPALQAGHRGDRKILVTELYAETEVSASATHWQPARDGESSAVMVTESTELAVFTKHASQDRHYHSQGNKLYTVLERRMHIEVERTVYALNPGDTTIVPPWSVHEVIRKRGAFLCQVVRTSCGGLRDKWVVNE